MHPPPACCTGPELLVVHRLAQRRRQREPVEVDAEHRLAQLGVVPAADPRRELDDVRAPLADHHLGVRRPLLDPERGCGRSGCLDRRADRCRLERAWPDMGESDSERGRLGDDPVGDGQRCEATADREGVDGHLAPGNELLDEHHVRARLLERERESVLELPLPADEHEPLLALPIGRLDHAWVAEAVGSRPCLLERRADHVARVRDARLGEPLALAELRGGQDGGGWVDRVRQGEPLGDPRGDRNRPVDAGRDDPVDALRRGEAVDLRLVLDGDDRPPVGEAKPRCGRIAVDGDDEVVPPSRGLEQAELAGPGP